MPLQRSNDLLPPEVTRWLMRWLCLRRPKTQRKTVVRTVHKRKRHLKGLVSMDRWSVSLAMKLELGTRPTKLAC